MLMAIAPMGESPSASLSSCMTLAEMLEPSSVSSSGLKAGSASSERVVGTNTWSSVMWPVLAWCFACEIRHEW
jgi:hypothetical protein